MKDTHSVTLLLRAWRDGDRNALDQLVPLIYSELRRIAANQVSRESDARLLQPTALVHEAYIRLAAATDPDFLNRDHFLSVACRVMRRILVENARARLASKRGSGAVQTGLNENFQAASATAGIVVALNDAMTTLEAHDEQAARVVEMKFFGGFTAEESARIMGLSPHQINWQMRVALAWLRRELSGTAN